MNHMAIQSTAKPLSAFIAAQQRSIVSYHLPSDFLSPQPVSICVEEARNLLAARGTTGLRVWDASLHLAYFLTTAGTSLVENKTVLELGAGTGLLSILCAGPLKARRVIATDGDAEVVAFIECNARLNRPLLERPPNNMKLDAKVLDWADTSAVFQVLQHEGNKISLDTVLGADITYAIDAWEPLLGMLTALTWNCPRVDIIISTAIRNEDTFIAFVEACAKASFRASSIPFDCPPLDQQRGFFHKPVPPIRIVRLVQRWAAEAAEVDQTRVGIKNYIS